MFGAFARLMGGDGAMPTACGLPTADPLTLCRPGGRSESRRYQHVPNLCGFGQGGLRARFSHTPTAKSRAGANLLARHCSPMAVLVWRCFVYNCKQDWRDTATDRPKAAYDHYAALDGEFAHRAAANQARPV